MQYTERAGVFAAEPTISKSTVGAELTYSQEYGTYRLVCSKTCGVDGDEENGKYIALEGLVFIAKDFIKFKSMGTALGYYEQHDDAGKHFDDSGSTADSFISNLKQSERLEILERDNYMEQLYEDVSRVEEPDGFKSDKDYACTKEYRVYEQVDSNKYKEDEHGMCVSLDVMEVSSEFKLTEVRRFILKQYVNIVRNNGKVVGYGITHNIGGFGFLAHVIKDNNAVMFKWSVPHLKM